MQKFVLAMQFTNKVIIFLAFAIGKGALAGGSALALGALCFYGLGLGSDSDTVMNNSLYVLY